MSLCNIWHIARKELTEHKFRFLLILISIPAISGIFLIPHLCGNTEFMKELVQQLNWLYPDHAAEIRRKFILVDLQLPLYVLVPAFASPFFGILESIIGEKDARTLEGLFFLPVSRWDILFGKVLPSMGGAIFVSWFSYTYHILFFGIFIDEDLAFHLLTIEWMLILAFLIPVIVYMIGIMAILISIIVNKIQTAVNLSTVILAPIFFMLAGIGLGYIEFGVYNLATGGIMILLAGIIITFILRCQFSIERLIFKLND